MKLIYLLLIIILISLSGCSKEPNEEHIIEKPKEVEYMAKALFVIAPNNFKDEEYFTPKEILEENNIEVITASLAKQAKGVDGGKATADILLDQATSDYDAIVFIGGGGARVYFDNTKAHSLAQQFNKKGKVVAAICIGPMTLANAGVLNGKKATVWNGEYKDRLEQKGATYTGESVTVDGNIITANGPSAAEEFGNEIVKKLS